MQSHFVFIDCCYGNGTFQNILLQIISDAGNLFRKFHFDPILLGVAQRHLQPFPLILKLNNASITRSEITDTLKILSDQYKFISLDARTIVNLMPHIADTKDLATEAIWKLDFGNSANPNNHEGPNSVQAPAIKTQMRPFLADTLTIG